MPPVYDRRALVVDRSPLVGLTPDPGKLPKLDAAALWGQWLAGLKELTGIDLSSPEALVQSLGELLGEALSPEKLVEVLSQVLGYTGAPLAGLAELAAWVNANLWGPIDPGRIPVLPVGQIGQWIASLLPNGMFGSASSIIDPTGKWVYDETVGKAAPGSARTTADGTIKDLLSTDLIAVSPGQVLDVEAVVQWANLVASGSPIELGLVTYSDVRGETMVGRPVIATPTGQTGTVTWKTLTGKYTVPQSGVKAARVRVTVGQYATAGSVWFDEVDATKSGLLPLHLISGLLDRLKHIDLDGLFDASKLFNIDLIPDIPDDRVLGVGGQGSIGQNIQDTWNRIWGALTGRNPDEPRTVDDQAAQIAELAATTAAHSSAIAELQAGQDGNTNGGVSGGDDFEREVGGNLGGLGYWAEFYTLGAGNGYYDIANGHEARWVDQGSAVNTGVFVRTHPDDAITETDYQKSTLVVGTVPGELPLLGVIGSQHVRVWLRVNNDAPTVGITDGVYVEVGGTQQAQIGYRRNGSDHLVGSPVACSWGVGTNLTLIAGTVDGVRTFRFLKNGSPLLAWTDSGNVTASGENYRRWGWEGQARTRGNGQGTPSAVARITIADNTPPAVQGTTMRAFRTNTSGVSLPRASDTNSTALPANVFDSIEYISSDLAWSHATNTVTFNTTRAATYLVTLRLEFSSPMGNGAYLLAIKRNGVTYSYNQMDQFPINVGGASSPVATVYGQFVVYAEPGDTVQMCRINTDAKTVVGGFGGAVTFVTVNRMG
ncbi:minor tail protein [Mycobacterium phage LastHope]|uniref:Minor tail protein n=1 Tax=Mycobacterium phage LastHope TaxID=2015886 RepID=A0A222ZS10_9CAUD|nr:minor tail protein [Mycobacterium phage LastHope]ASR87195.1 minor tail protein [Mycobacterium phage LastHope]